MHIDVGEEERYAHEQHIKDLIYVSTIILVGNRSQLLSFFTICTANFVGIFSYIRAHSFECTYLLWFAA